jgi:hypothetical protein
MKSVKCLNIRIVTSADVTILTPFEIEPTRRHGE